MGDTDVLMLVASDDPLYNLRQVEQILANFPNYAWFDPMTLYPHGSPIYWGPLFPTIIAICCLITGAATRTEIISVGLLIPPLMAVATIAIMYFVGKTCGDWKTGYSGFRVYRDHHRPVLLPFSLRIYGPPYRRSPFFNTLLPFLYVCDPVRERDKNRSEKSRFL